MVNIAEILKNKPKWTKLYSPIFGELKFETLIHDLNEDTIVARNGGLEQYSFMSDGRYNRNGEPLMLLPSKEMRDWSKFDWKKGDVLVSNDGTCECIFEKFVDDTYRNFIGKHYLNSKDENNVKYIEVADPFTENYSIENKDATQCYINTIEERLGGKLNLDTLEVEKKNSGIFHEGDIVAVEQVTGHPHKKICILKSYADASFNAELDCCAFYSIQLKFFDSDCKVAIEGRTVRLATEDEKLLLFYALAKEGKRWNAETKQIEDIKTKCEFKPFDKVLYKNGGYENPIWVCGLFCHQDKSGCMFVIGSESAVSAIVPYNEKTAHLIGTTEDYKED